MITAAAAFNANVNLAGDNTHSTINLANVEALASGEDVDPVTCSNSCGGAKCGTFTDNDGNSWPVYYC